MFRTQEKKEYVKPYQDGHKSLKTYLNSLDHSKALMNLMKKWLISFMATLLKIITKVDMLRYNKCHLVASCSRETKRIPFPPKSRSKNPD